MLVPDSHIATPTAFFRLHCVIYRTFRTADLFFLQQPMLITTVLQTSQTMLRLGQNFLRKHPGQGPHGAHIRRTRIGNRVGLGWILTYGLATKTFAGSVQKRSRFGFLLHCGQIDLRAPSAPPTFPYGKGAGDGGRAPRAAHTFSYGKGASRRPWLKLRPGPFPGAHVFYGRAASSRT